MKTSINERSKYITAILLLIFICEVMFNSNNKILQVLGIFILPIILIYGILLLKNEKTSKKI